MPARWRLVRGALDHGAYEVRPDGSVRGLLYAPFLGWTARRFGVTGWVEPDASLDALVASVGSDQFVVASVSSEIRNPRRTPERRGGHLVLIVGIDERDVIFHNPSCVPPHQANARLPREVFTSYYADRGFVMRRPRGTPQRA